MKNTFLDEKSGSPTKKQTKLAVLEKYFTNNEMANRCLTTFFDAIKENLEESDLEKIAYVCHKITLCLIKNDLLTDKNLLRSKLLNLKDKKNKKLCENVYNEIISAEKFVFMSTDEMKSSELKELEENMKKNILLEMQVPRAQAETDIFKCSKCGKRQCSYRQLQTRSADEPMTTFVSCISCGHKWKF